MIVNGNFYERNMLCKSPKPLFITSYNKFWRYIFRKNIMAYITGRFKKKALIEIDNVSCKFFHFMKFQGKCLCSQKIMPSPVVLHIITFWNSKYCLRYIQSKFTHDACNIESSINNEMKELAWNFFNFHFYETPCTI